MSSGPLMPDHYATLGVEPTAKGAEIRAAYLGLMREHHPDRNPSPEAVTRAQAAIAAFKVLGDFDRRNHYDWDRRREREAAALAVRRPGGKRAGAIAAVAVGLAAAGAWLFLPAPTSEPKPVPTVAEARQAPAAKARPAPTPQRSALAPPAESKVAPRVEVAKVEPIAPPASAVRLAKAEPVRPNPNIDRAPMARVAVAPTAHVVPTPPPPRPTKAVAKAAARPAAKTTTDLASLDQFVMNFYGQSWRYGDAPKRAALAQSRSKFVSRRRECAADECKRSAYLKLMRDVSEIVETGQPKTR